MSKLFDVSEYSESETEEPAVWATAGAAEQLMKEGHVGWALELRETYGEFMESWEQMDPMDIMIALEEYKKK